MSEQKVHLRSLLGSCPCRAPFPPLLPRHLSVASEQGGVPGPGLRHGWGAQSFNGLQAAPHMGVSCSGPADSQPSPQSLAHFSFLAAKR